MAPRLKQGETTDAKVVRLNTRKARGAGGQKRSSKPPNRLKKPEHEAKPKAAKAAKPAPAATVAPQPTEAEVRRHAQDRLIALHGQLKPIEAKMAAAQETLSELRGQKQAVRGHIQGIVPLKIYDELRSKVDAKTKRADNELYEKQRALAFEAFGLPVGPQPELDLQGVPEAAKPALYWDEVGYRSAIDGLFSDPQRDGVPPENVQDYMKGFSRGIERNAEGLKKLEEPEAIPEAPPPLFVGQKPEDASIPEGTNSDGQPDWSEFDDDPAKWTNEQADVFRLWFESLAEDAEVDILHPGVALAFDVATGDAGEVQPLPTPAVSEMI